jgi:hypothetical protein
MGQETESGIHWEFHQMLAEGDAPSWWMLSEAEWFWNNNFFLTAPAELTCLIRRRVNLKSDDGFEHLHLDLKSKDFLIFRWSLEMSMTKSDCYQKFGMVLKK